MAANSDRKFESGFNEFISVIPKKNHKLIGNYNGIGVFF